MRMKRGIMLISAICLSAMLQVATGAGALSEVGRRVWVNECAGTRQGLVSWNAGERFPSLGIGHFIWYPDGIKEPFEESFPKFIAYAKAHRVQVPAYFQGPAPWPTRAAFVADRSGLANKMRDWLAATVELQTQYLFLRLHAAQATLLQASRNPQAVKARYDALSRTSQGLYCLVDYVNFKGEGIKRTERYAGQGWGLLQVLEEMRPVTPAAAPAEFSRAAEIVIRRRVKNSPPTRGEKRWLTGWLNRCKTYAR